MSGISNLIDSNGDPKTAEEIGGVVENITNLNKSFFDNKIFAAISGIVEHLQGKTGGGERDVGDFGTIQQAIDSLPT